MKPNEQGLLTGDEFIETEQYLIRQALLEVVLSK